MSSMTIYRTSCKSLLLLPMVAAVFGFSADRASAQTAPAKRYVHFPSERVDDGRFLSMAGSGLNTLAQDIALKIASPGTASTLEIGIFDGETGGRWDQGSVPLEYILYADPQGDATGTVEVARWSGSTMPDNNWFVATINNAASAKGPGSGNYFYWLRVRNTDPSVTAWSNFKVRTDGTVAIMRNRAFAYVAAMFSLADGQTIFPKYPTLSPTTYDGTWDFYINLVKPQTSLAIWDGDMDYGSFDGATKDTDDPDTRNDAVPSWAVGTAAVAEGVAGKGLATVDAAGNPLGGTTTSNPPDDHRTEAVRRSPSVSYDVITPDGRRFSNTNPSGNLEWEQFNLSTAPMDRATMDYHADSLPAGIYHIHIYGVDMTNLNAWVFPVDGIGVDDAGVPVAPIASDFEDGSIEGVIYYDANNNLLRDAGEPGIPSVTITLSADYNGDGRADSTFSTVTDVNGWYKFSNLRGGTYKVAMDMATLADDIVPTVDPDGTGSTNAASITLSSGDKAKLAYFGYKRSNPPGTGTRGYWVNHSEKWPLWSITLGGVTYTKEEAIAILQRATRGDKTYSMAAQLIATKLNLANGNNSSCIASTVAAADTWMQQNPLGSGAKKTWTQGEPYHNALDDYNNGRLCASHMD